MRKLTSLTVAALLTLAACSNDGDDGQDTRDHAAEFIVADTKQAFLGQHGRRYDTLHPAHQALVNREQFIACSTEAAGQGGEVDVEVIESYDTTETIPGTDIETAARAITIKVTAPGEEATRTRHAIEVDGTWRWAMSADMLESCVG